MARVLAADIGATHSRFGVFGVEAGRGPVLEGSLWLATREAESFGEVLDRAMDGLAVRVGDLEWAVFAVAGPVIGERRSAPPFIDWPIDLDQLPPGAVPGKSLVINDFAAQAWATLRPGADHLEEILPGRVEPGAARAVIGAGSNLGQAALVPDRRGGWQVAVSEGGHASFPFEDPGESGFMEYLKKETGNPYTLVNTVVSGKGLAHVHAYLTGERLSPREAARAMLPGSETLAWFAGFYGRACRNWALQVLARGGVTVTGGVAGRTPKIVLHPAFETAFRTSPTLGDILAEIPVFLNRDPEAGLWGAALCGLDRWPG